MRHYAPEQMPMPMPCQDDDARRAMPMACTPLQCAPPITFATRHHARPYRLPIPIFMRRAPRLSTYREALEAPRRNVTAISFRFSPPAYDCDSSLRLPVEAILRRVSLHRLWAFDDSTRRLRAWRFFDFMRHFPRAYAAATGRYHLI